MAKKPKAPSKTSIEKSAYDVWSKCIRAKQRVCRICGSDSGLQAHHIRSRTHAATRFDLANGLCVCRKCHIIQKFNPELFQDRVIEVVGDREYQRLKRKSLVPYKLGTNDLKDVIDRLKDELKRIEDEYGVYRIADEFL